jgi:hypothetical protein
MDESEQNTISEMEYFDVPEEAAIFTATQFEAFICHPDLRDNELGMAFADLSLLDSGYTLPLALTNTEIYGINAIAGYLKAAGKDNLDVLLQVFAIMCSMPRIDHIPTQLFEDVLEIPSP